MTTPTFANSGNVQPVFGQEIALCSIAGSFAAVDAYVQGGSKNAPLEFRLYATVGGLRTKVATAQYLPPASGPALNGSVLQWTSVGGAVSNPVVAGGTQYDLTVYAGGNVGTPVAATLAGTNAFDANVNQSATVAMPSGFGSQTLVTNVGCAQFADVGVDQASLVACAFDVFVSCGAGSVEAWCGEGIIGGPDGDTDVIRQLPLPVGTQYRLAVRNTDGGRGVGNVTASLATYDSEVVAPVPASGITPGPALTVLRSVPALAVTKTAWANSGYVDFVADCGADPTGAADSAPAFDVAYQILSQIANLIPKFSLTLFIPPGKYAINSNVVTSVWNFINLGTSLKIVGAGRDTSIIQLNGFQLPTVANVYEFDMLDLSITGIQVPFALDAPLVMEISPSYIGTIQRCNFVMILTSDGVFNLLGGIWSIRDCAFSSCGATNSAKAVLYSSQIAGMNIDSCTFIDIGVIDQYPLQNKTSTNRNWYRHDDSLAVGSGYQTHGILIRNCVFDESCETCVYVKGGPTANITYLHLDGNAFNPPILGFKIGCVHAENVELVRVEGLIDSGDPASDPQTPVLDLVNVGTAHVDKITVRAPAKSNYLQADAACGALIVSNSPNLVVNTSAKATTIRPAGWTEPNYYAVALQGA